MRRSVAHWPAWATAALSVYGAWFLLATAFGAWRTYTPVPVWDMWHYVSFLSAVADGAGWPAWWELMNEHRIVLTRALFWLTEHVFHGSFAFLIAVNFVLAGSAVVTFFLYLKARAPLLTRQQTVLAGVVMGCWLLSWVQDQNLAWAFQSQFFLAQLLPLIGFYLLYRSTQPDAPAHYFAAACVMGILSIGTMINGIMALPMMVMYAVALRMRWSRIVLLIVLSLLCLAAYLVDYSSPGNHGSVIGALKSDPVRMLQFMVQYLGSPFQLMAKVPSWMWLGQAFGIVFLAMTLHQLSLALRAPRSHAVELSLLTFVVYVSGIAFATAGGRMGFGLESALSSRYTTPTLMAWAALAILYWPQLGSLKGKPRALAVALLVLLLVLMMAVQMRATHRTDAPHRQMTGALALVLEVRDTSRTGMLIWDELYGVKLARLGEQHGLGVFSKPPLAGASQLLGTRQDIPAAACSAYIDAVSRLPDDPRFLRVTGLLLADDPTPPQSLRLLDTDGTVMGIGVPDRMRKRNVEGGGTRQLMHLRFTAYLQLTADKLPAHLVLTAPGSACAVSLTLPAPH